MQITQNAVHALAPTPAEPSLNQVTSLTYRNMSKNTISSYLRDTEQFNQHPSIECFFVCPLTALC